MSTRKTLQGVLGDDVSNATLSLAEMLFSEEPDLEGAKSPCKKKGPQLPPCPDRCVSVVRCSPAEALISCTGVNNLPPIFGGIIE